MSIDSSEEVTPIPLPSTKRTYNEDSGLGDDEELQEVLAQRRRQALKKRKISRPEDIVAHVRQLEDEQPIANEEGGLVIDDTSEFVRGLEMAHLTTEPEKDDGEEMKIDSVPDTEDVDMPDTTGEAEETEILPSTGLDDEVIIADSVAATLAALHRQGIALDIHV
jgi:U4/U6.U5 tri-snRNP-associated protein 1